MITYLAEACHDTWSAGAGTGAAFLGFFGGLALILWALR